MEIQINLLAVVLATLSSMVVGAIWYSQKVFGAWWMKTIGLDMKKAEKGSLRAILITIVVSFITAYVLAHMTFLAFDFYDLSYLQAVLTTAFWLWLGFTAARFITHDAFEQRPVKLTLLNVAHEFVTLMIMGLIIGLLAP